jgi:hypothetical protein
VTGSDVLTAGQKFVGSPDNSDGDLMDEEILLVAANAWRMEEQNAIKTAIIATDIKAAKYSSMVCCTLPMIIYNVDMENNIFILFSLVCFVIIYLC